jgi:hypothetical protein
MSGIIAVHEFVVSVPITDDRACPLLALMCTGAELTDGGSRLRQAVRRREQVCSSWRGPRVRDDRALCWLHYRVRRRMRRTARA